MDTPTRLERLFYPVGRPPGIVAHTLNTSVHTFLTLPHLIRTVSKVRG